METSLQSGPAGCCAVRGIIESVAWFTGDGVKLITAVDTKPKKVDSDALKVI